MSAPESNTNAASSDVKGEGAAHALVSTAILAFAHIHVYTSGNDYTLTVIWSVLVSEMYAHAAATLRQEVAVQQHFCSVSTCFAVCALLITCQTFVQQTS